MTSFFRLTLGDYATNTYIIAKDGEAIIIDPATEEVVDFLAENNLSAKFVLLTHGHFDHIGGVAALKDEGAEVFISRDDFVCLHMLNSFFGRSPRTFSPTYFVSDKKRFTLLNNEFEVITTPGHTPGSVCYLWNGKTILSGDTIFRLGVGRTDFPLGNDRDMNKSLAKLFALPGDYKVLGGHGDFTSLDNERVANGYGYGF